MYYVVAVVRLDVILASCDFTPSLSLSLSLSPTLVKKWNSMTQWTLIKCQEDSETELFFFGKQAIKSSNKRFDDRLIATFVPNTQF